MASVDTPNDGEIPAYSREEMNVPEVRDTIQDRLNPLEMELLEVWRTDFCRWTFDRGKHPEFYEGYPPSSMRNIINRVEKFCEWLFAEDGFTTEFTEDHLSRYWRVLLKEDTEMKSKARDIRDVRVVLKYQNRHKYEEDDYQEDLWNIPNSKKVHKKINKEEKNLGFRDWHTPTELKGLKTASLRLHSVPNPDDLDAAEYDKWASHLAQRLEKPRYELDDDDWAEANSWKIPSLVYLSCDVGPRPCEVETFKVDWLYLDDEEEAYISVPREEDRKDGKNNWRCYISRESVRILNRWLDERRQNPLYKDRDEIWLTRYGNPYDKDSLRSSVMIPLQREAGIDTDRRENGWYMIRRGVGTDIANEEKIHELMNQLRINSVETALRYVQNSEKGVRNWFDNR